MADIVDQWEEFLNPETVRTKLISAGMFLIGHEMLIDSIKRHLVAFFATEWVNTGPRESQRYKDEVRGLDPKRRDDALRGSIQWLRNMDAISADDEIAIERVTTSRNVVAHELAAMISGGRTTDFAQDFETLLHLVQKIEKWWMVNVELPTNPDHDEQEIDEDAIISGPSMIMQILGQVALGDQDKVWEFHREFRKASKAETAKSRVRFVDELLAGEFECNVSLTANGAVLSPLDEDEDADAREFQIIVEQVISHDGEGYEIGTLASSRGPEPGSPIDHVWIITH
jgi:hypothetical protein